jgi:hypothetical protein
MTKKKKILFSEISEFPTQVTLSESDFSQVGKEFEFDDRGVFFAGECFHVVILLSRKVSEAP